MLQPTRSALNVLRAIVKSERPEVDCLRLKIGGGGPRLMAAKVRSDDATIVEDDGKPLLVAKRSIADHVDGQTLDFNEALSQLTVR